MTSTVCLFGDRYKNNKKLFSQKKLPNKVFEFRELLKIFSGTFRELLVFISFYFLGYADSS